MRTRRDDKYPFLMSIFGLGEVSNTIYVLLQSLPVRFNAY